MEINLGYLNRAFERAGLKIQFKNREAVIGALDKKIRGVRVADIMKDIGRFLEDPSEETWLKDYRAAFRQAVGK